MDAHKQLTIGLFGFGVVGEGLYKVLQQTPSLKASIKKVCIKNPEKKRNAPDSLFTTDKDVLLNDPEINVIVEVINESENAFHIVSTALKNGKDVVSASKKMIAEHLPELLELQKQTDRSFLCEAAACASIPVIRNLEEYYDNDLLHSIKAIVNGSTNFILTKMFEENLSFRDALILAQQLGFAESDPTLDVEGYDAVNKWAFLLTHAYGIIEHPDNIVFNGIQNVQAGDANVAREKHYDIKLVAQAKKLQNGKVAAFVLPQFIKHDDHLAFVKNEYNGVVIESGFADKQFFYGKGAGSFPTASAVLSDLSALRYQYKYEYKKLYHHTPQELTNDFYVRVYVSFDDWKYIPKDKFEWIEEWHAETDRKYLVGVLSFDELRSNSWWRENNTSLILSPDAIIEDVEIRKLKKKSLELAGIV
ncbi:homoserine dehydrogenase [Pseudobacter ginsenosidimutans]|uniref:Homoserine dehydrogenase n=1 Tax=Pseudobacter ginsenosidimutans TaxID=661488 RepID=A0A4Q7MMQ9_9BACT|nr:homoserine dehydrogenase [Pseudobacter ginsenosidimutans]QEC40429.1 homoserine dehydrogenase [Pseudobacter ginsenosidimutans]RZS68963.1 homoserine dehydrogenase [Pseudobacter ginsenosidimutans]